MRLLLVPALISVLSAACAAPPPASAVDAASARRIEADVARELDDLHAAAAGADEARYFAHFAADGVFLGTDATERWDLEAFRAYAHPHFKAGKAWRFRAARRAITVSPDGQVAWFDEDLVTEKLGPARGSGVLTRRNGAWKIAQYNLSTVVPNDRFDEVRAILAAPPPAPRR